MDSASKLNLACGKEYLDGYVNIDNCSMYDCHVDLEADIRTMKWNENSLDEIRLSHFMMYVRPEEARVLFKRWFSWLKKGGVLDIETIDVQNVASIVAMGDGPSEINDYGLVNLFGTDRTGPHRWGWYRESLLTELYDAGFKTCRIRDGKKKPKRDFRVLAIK